MSPGSITTQPSVTRKRQNQGYVRIGHNSLVWGIGLFLLDTLTARFIDNNRTTIPKLLYGLVAALVFGGLLSQWNRTCLLDNE